MNETTVRLKIKFFGDMKRSYNRYAAMRKWLSENKVIHNFEWVNTGHYLPSTIVMDSESAVMFTFLFLVDQ